MFVAVCEDSTLERVRIVDILNSIDCIKHVVNFDEPTKLLNYFKSNRVDLVILDINLPTMNGIEAARAIRRIDPEVFIVFVTGYDNFCLKAFSLYATDYILKPFNPDRLERTIRRVYKSLDKQDNRIVEIKTQNVIYRVKQSEIILIEKVLNRCNVYTEQFTFDVITPLKYFEDILDKDKFVRTHAGYLVNKDKISKIEVNGNLSYTVYFNNIEKTALVSRGKKDKLIEHKHTEKVVAGD
ncbi:MAG: LytTR family DNA-binding domain-containing protein [Clostridia bacterium]|nr:LytTR family DNA-binding domain-containing protein [Clostridia bacterium]